MKIVLIEDYYVNDFTLNSVFLEKGRILEYKGFAFWGEDFLSYTNNEKDIHEDIGKIYYIVDIYGNKFDHYIPSEICVKLMDYRLNIINDILND